MSEPDGRWAQYMDDLRIGANVHTPLEVRGTVAVPEADLHLERLDMGVSASPDVVVLDPADPQKAAAAPVGKPAKTAARRSGNARSARIASGL